MLFSVRFGMSNQIRSNQIKSNQIILSNITYPIRRWIIQPFPCISVSEGRSKQSLSQPNSHFFSIYFSWLMCCQNYHVHWSLFYDYLDYHLQGHYHHWMKWYVVWEDLEWEMNNHHILSNTATWQKQNDSLPKVTISNDGRSKTSFSFPFKSHFIISFHTPFNEKSAYLKLLLPNLMDWIELRLDNSNDLKYSKLR